MNKGLKIFLAVCGSLLLLVAVGVSWLAWEFRPQPPDSEVPKLARSLGGDWRDWKKANLEFRRRLEAQFPPGTSETQLIKELRAEGFHLQMEAARFEQTKFPCAYRWYISWHQQDGHIKNIKSYYDAGCL